MSSEETSEGGDSKELEELVWASQGLVNFQSLVPGTKRAEQENVKFSTSEVSAVAPSANFRVTRANAATWWPVGDTAGGQGRRRSSCRSSLPAC